MNIDSFYNELIDDLELFRLETKVSDEIIMVLFQAYSEGKCSLEELIELIEVFIFELRRFDLEDDEIIDDARAQTKPNIWHIPHEEIVVFAGSGAYT